LGLKKSLVITVAAAAAIEVILVRNYEQLLGALSFP